MADAEFSGSSEAIPLVRTAPLYPPSALSRKIEGRFKVLCTVTEDGSVLDPKIIEADPLNVFDSSAMCTIRKWKLRMKVINGNRYETALVHQISIYLLIMPIRSIFCVLQHQKTKKNVRRGEVFYVLLRLIL